MNRAKKEFLKAYNKAREGLTPTEIEELDKAEAKAEIITERVSEVHSELFPEEYDFIYDDHVDYNGRNKGENPMSAEYIERINKKRVDAGSSPLSENGMSVSSDTRDYCYQKVISESPDSKTS